MLAPTTPTPLDAFDRRAEWEFAALVVALVLVPGLASAMAAEARSTGRGAAGTVDTRAVPALRGGRSRHVRPPRAC